MQYLAEMLSGAARQWVIVSIVLLAACGAEVSQPTEPAIELVDQKVGSHQLQFTVPKGWQHLDLGGIQSFRGSGALLEMEDLGTYSRSGLTKHIEQAQRLYRGGNRLAAQEHLKRLPFFQGAFLKSDDWRQVEPFWKTLMRGQEQDQPERVKQAYQQVLTILSQQPRTDFETVTRKLLDIEDRNGQRDIAEWEIVSIDGRKAVLVETWDKLSHSMKQKRLFILNEDNILSLRVRSGPYEDIVAPFDQITASIEFQTDGEA